MNSKRFRIGFSFAGEKRDFVAKAADILAERFGRDRILYDKYHEAELARSDLGIYLPELYHNQTDLVVVVVCPDYAEKEWCGLEWTAIHDLVKQRKVQEVLLTRFGRAKVKGLYSTAGFVDLDDKTSQQTAFLILERLAQNNGKAKDYYVSSLQSSRTCTSSNKADPKNHLLIPGTAEGGSFNDRLRDILLLKLNKDALHIGTDYYATHHCPSEEWWPAYLKGWDEFLLDKDAEWLFTVHPESHKEPEAWRDDKIRERFGDLAKGDHVKRVLFFESGLDVGSSHQSLVFTVKTDYKDAVTHILRQACEELKFSSTLIVFMLLGPNAEPANVRRRIYHRFLSYLVRDFQLEGNKHNDRPDEDNEEPLTSIARQIRPTEIFIVGVPMKTWLQKEAEDIFTQQLRFMSAPINALGDGGTIMLLCGNDDIALGAYHSLAEYRDTTTATPGRPATKIVFVGFDGSKRMERLIKDAVDENIWAITAEVRVRDMVQKAIDIVEKVHSPDSLRILNRAIPASITFTRRRT